MYYRFGFHQFTCLNFKFGYNTETFTANRELILYFNTLD